MSDPQTTLAEFLLARIAEDEAAELLGRDDFAASVARASDKPLTEVRESLSRTSHFKRGMAECDAKRRIVEEHEGEVARGPAGPRDDFVARHGGILDAYGYALRLLALPYADHPDYRDEWRP